LTKGCSDPVKLAALEEALSHITFIKKTLSPTSPTFNEDVISLVREFCPSLFPSSEPLTITPLTAGITNNLVAVSSTNPPINRVIVRMYGTRTDCVIDRSRELLIVASHPLAAKVYGRFENGIVSEYLPGSTLDPDDISDPNLAASVARTVRAFHVPTSSIVGLEKEQQFYATMRKWMTALDEKSEKLGQHLKNVGGKDVLEKEVMWHESETMKREDKGGDVCLCHNDILFANILWDKETGNVRLIDFEYAASGYVAEDIANHFCEWCGFDTEWWRYPSQEQQRKFVRTYLAGKDNVDVDEKDVDRLLNQVEWFEMASSLYWGIWAYLQATVSTKKFPYADYAERRMLRYFDRKKAYAKEHGLVI